MTYVVKNPVSRRRNWYQPHFVAPVRVHDQEPQPAVNIAETDEAFELSLVAPGWQRENFVLSVDKDGLSVEGKAPEVDHEHRYTRREFALGSFERRFHLPETIDTENISATYQDGILRVQLPKVAPEQTVRSISVQ